MLVRTLGYRRLKPGASRAIHLFTASLLWSIVGLTLMVRGWQGLEVGAGLWLLIPSLFLGTAKSIYILDRIAQRNIARILQFNDFTCLGAVYSWRTWLLVVGMMIFGVVARLLIKPGTIMGVTYLAIGWALLFSGRFSWRAWFRLKSFPGNITK